MAIRRQTFRLYPNKTQERKLLEARRLHCYLYNACISYLSVGFAELNKMLTYKIEEKGGLMIILETKKIKPSQRCLKCGHVHKEWTNLSNRYHICDNCGFGIPRDKGSLMVLYNVANDQQQGLGTNLSKRGCLSSTSENRKHTGSMKQLGQMKRQKSQTKEGVALETPSSV